MDPLLSFRPTLLAQLGPLAALLGGGPALTDALAEAVVRVSSLKEEGEPLAPAVFVARELPELLEAVRGSTPVAVGSGPCEGATVRLALKRCAPLGERRQWALYLLHRGPGLEYGIFLTDRAPLRPTSFEALRLRPPGGPPVLGITQLGESVVEVRGPGGALLFDCSGTADLSTSPARVIRDFVRAVTAEAPPALAPRFAAFYYRVALEVVTGIPGALVAVLGAGQAAPECLADGVWLQTPLDIGELVRRYEASHDEADALALVSHSGLFRRMIGMDGVTVFASDGRLLAYNAFIHEQMLRPPARSVVGGARRRAYEVLCAELGRSLVGVLYRSRDGAAESRLALPAAGAVAG